MTLPENINTLEKAKFEEWSNGKIAVRTKEEPGTFPDVPVYLDMVNLLGKILKEIKISNVHLAKISGLELIDGDEK